MNASKVHPTIRWGQIVRREKTTEGTDFHRLSVKGKKQELYQSMQRCQTSTQNSCEEDSSPVVSSQILRECT